MITPGSILLSKKERRAAIRLLSLLQDHLESAIESSTLADGTIQPGDPIAAKNVPLDRRARKAAERLVKKLEVGLRG